MIGAPVSGSTVGADRLELTESFAPHRRAGAGATRQVVGCAYLPASRPWNPLYRQDQTLGNPGVVSEYAPSMTIVGRHLPDKTAGLSCILHEKETLVREVTEAQIRLETWHDVGRWLDYAAAEFVADQTTRAYLEHVAVCIRDEGERRFGTLAGFEPAVSA